MHCVEYNISANNSTYIYKNIPKIFDQVRRCLLLSSPILIPIRVNFKIELFIFFVLCFLLHLLQNWWQYPMNKFLSNKINQK